MGPYGITQFDAAGVLGAYQAAQENRIRSMLLQRQIAKEDREADRTGKESAAWAKLWAPKAGGTSAMSGAYGTPGIGDGIPGNPPAASVGSADPSQSVEGMRPARSGGLNIDPAAAQELASVLGPERGMQFLQQWQSLNEAQRKAVAAHHDEIGQAIVWADTPEKWDQAVDFYSRTNPAIAKYKGRFDQRPQAAMEIGAMKAFAEGSQPKLRNVGVGDVVMDENTGRTVFESPVVSGPGGEIFSRPPAMSTMQPPRVASTQDYEALPPGTTYIDPNGVRRTKGGPAPASGPATFP